MQGGNNNTYCHDDELNWFNWEQAKEDGTGFARFFRCLINLRCAAGWERVATIMLLAFVEP